MSGDVDALSSSWVGCSGESIDDHVVVYFESFGLSSSG